jgi:glycosyltransferase involved in cell wall biosynthesis
MDESDKRSGRIRGARDGVALLWENLGPMHVDRCEATARLLGSDRVTGIELFPSSEVYAWDRPESVGVRRITLFDRPAVAPGAIGLAFAILRAVRRSGAGSAFLCHYERPGISIAAWLLRLSGRRVFAMSCSKFDDRPRHAWREALKTLALKPFHGAISSGTRARDYMRFLGIDVGCIAGEYNTLSIARMREQANMPSAPAGLAFADRAFVAVARFVPKKNLAMLIEAFALYRRDNPGGRRLVLCGSGPLEGALRAQVEQLGLEREVEFTGFLQTEEVSKVIARGLALVLPSIEEQFGNVVIEAQALGLPVILAENCGAHDRLVRSGVHGFVIEPDNAEGLAYFMSLLAADESLWHRMSLAAGTSAEKGDAAVFAEGVSRLLAN